MNSKIVLTPIGELRVSAEEWRLEIEEPYRPALAGLEGFGYIQVLWWAHQMDSEELRAIRTCPQPYREGPAELGLFATRSPVRPNPIALTAVPLLHVDFARGTISMPRRRSPARFGACSICSRARSRQGDRSIRGCSCPVSHVRIWNFSAVT